MRSLLTSLVLLCSQEFQTPSESGRVLRAARCFSCSENVLTCSLGRPSLPRQCWLVLFLLLSFQNWSPVPLMCALLSSLPPSRKPFPLKVHVLHILHYEFLQWSHFFPEKPSCPALPCMITLHAVHFVQ